MIDARSCIHTTKIATMFKFKELVIARFVHLILRSDDDPTIRRIILAKNIRPIEGRKRGRNVIYIFSAPRKFPGFIFYASHRLIVDGDFIYQIIIIIFLLWFFR